MKDQRLDTRFAPAWSWPAVALALAAAALLLAACVQTTVRTSVSVARVMALTVTPARVPPVTTAPQATGVTGCLNEQNWQQYYPDALRQLATFCVELASGQAITVEQAAALGAIQQLFADPALQPLFQGIASMPNAPNGQLPAVFFDDDERRYWVDLASGRVVEVDARGVQADWAASPLPEAELRARAEQFIQRATPGFAGVAERLQFQSGSKDGVLYFYRWEDRNATGWTNLPPLAQVGITVSGRVVAYLNTLFLATTGSGGPAPSTLVPVPTPSLSPPASVVADQAANAQSGPGTDYESVGQLTAGQAYTVMGQNGDWWLIALGDGRAGFVAKAVVAFSGDEAAVPVVDAPPTPAAP